MNIVDRIRADRVGPPQLPAQPTAQPPEQRGAPSFADHLRSACREIGSELSFSKHAAERVQDRRLELSADQLARIDRAVLTAADKGGKTALVMMDDMALLVGLKDRRIITVVNGEAMRENVFTAIDTAVIA